MRKSAPMEKESREAPRKAFPNGRFRFSAPTRTPGLEE